MSSPEVLLWLRLRTRKNGMVFRRQHPIGPYILDFYCAKARLAVEVDGENHYYDEQQTKDAVRDAWLAAQGVETLRISNDEIIAASEEMAERIWFKAAARIGRR